MKREDHRRTAGLIGKHRLDWQGADAGRRAAIEQGLREAAKAMALLSGWDGLCDVFETFEQTHGAEAAAWLDRVWTGVEFRGMVWAS